MLQRREIFDRIQFYFLENEQTNLFVESHRLDNLLMLDNVDCRHIEIYLRYFRGDIDLTFLGYENIELLYCIALNTFTFQ